MTTNRAPIILEGATSPLSSPSAERTHRLKVVLCFLSIYFIWGSTYLAIRYAVETIPPLYTAGIRHLTAGAILLLWCLAKRLRPTWQQIRASIIIGTFFFLIGHGTLHWAEQKVPSGLASLLIASEPIWVFLMSAAAARQLHWNRTLLLGILLGLSGVGLLMGRSALASAPGMFVGSLAVVLGALSWSVGVVYSRRSHLSGHPLLLSALSLLAGSLQLLLVGTVAGEYRGFSLASVSLRSWLSLGYLIVFGSVVAFTAYSWLLEHYSPTLVATHTYVNPVVAVLLGWFFASEVITLNVLLSSALVIGAVMLVDRGTASLPKQL
ncbi:MAG TPA: EamA family transporter [Candidatus Acidoferrum sp.]|jgi:drug/metabolite transporter (DMT)-like permease|nr:EamA family transporter [Candidatus Acidoferrum sp.]